MSLKEIYNFLTDELYHPYDTAKIIITYLKYNIVETLNTVMYQHKKGDQAYQVFNYKNEILVHISTNNDTWQINYLNDIEIVKSVPIIDPVDLVLVNDSKTNCVIEYFGYYYNYNTKFGQCYSSNNNSCYLTDKENKYAKCLNGMTQFIYVQFYDNFFLRTSHTDCFKIINMITNTPIQSPDKLHYILLRIYKNILFFRNFNELVMYRLNTKFNPWLEHFKTIYYELRNNVVDVCVVKNDMYVLIASNPSYINVYNFKSHKLKRTITFSKNIEIMAGSVYQMCANNDHIYIVKIRGLIILNRTESDEKKDQIVINL